MRQDLADLDVPVGGPLLGPKAVSAALDRLTQVAAAQAGVALRVDVGREVASFLAGEMLARVVVRAVVPEGLAASAPATLGVGLLAAVAADQVIAWTWHAYADPRGELAKALNDQLDEIEHRVFVGTPEAPGYNPGWNRGLRNELRNAGR